MLAEISTTKATRTHQSASPANPPVDAEQVELVAWLSAVGDDVLLTRSVGVAPMVLWEALLAELVRIRRPSLFRNVAAEYRAIQFTWSSRPASIREYRVVK